MRLIANLTLVALSLALVFLAVNATFPLVFSQRTFPRALVQYAGQLQYVLYPDTYERDWLDRWVAVVGDSYGQGMGDAFLNGAADYSMFHHLKRWTGQNYLIFARSGFGSINAARQLIVSVELMNRSLLFPDLGPPAEIIVVFYEGNDLDNNILHLAGLADPPPALPAFVRAQIERPASIRERIDSLFPFAGLPLRIARGLVQPARPPVATPNRLRLHGRELALPALQGAAIELTEAQIDRALAAFDAALEVLQAWSPSSTLRVVYVPSVVTAYRWRQPVVLNVYHSEQVLRTSSSANLRRSEAIRAKVRAQLLRRGVDFIDTTDAIRRRGQQALLHGPRDWEHVNGLGYAVLAEEIFRAGR